MADIDARESLSGYGYLLGTFDIMMLVGLLGAAAWWLYNSRKDKMDEIMTNKYISPDGVAQTDREENSFVKKLKSSGRRLVVFYGSQTGTGEEFAVRLAKEGIRYKMKGMVADPEQCDMGELVNLKDIDNSLAVFCMATYGDGVPTDNALEFYEWLKNEEPDLSGLNYAVFGLGNKTYALYNVVAIYIDKRLEELGATRVYEMGLGDDDANIEDDFITWQEKFWPAVCKQFNMKSTGEEQRDRQYRLVTHAPGEIPAQNIFTGEMDRLLTLHNQRPPFNAKNPFLAQIKLNRELDKDGLSWLHVELDITDSKMRYEDGDLIAMYPIIDPVLVERLGELTGANLDEVFSLINTDLDSTKKHPFPCPTTYRVALTHYLEITALPRTHVLRALAEYCTDDEDKKKLLLMSTSSAAGKALYQSFVVEACRNVVHILEDIKSCRPPVDHLCELLPRLQSRVYAISSNPKVHPDTVHVSVVVQDQTYKTTTGRVNKAVATTWLADLRPVDGQTLPKVPVFIRKSQNRLSENVEADDEEN